MILKNMYEYQEITVFLLPQLDYELGYNAVLSDIKVRKCVRAPQICFDQSVLKYYVKSGGVIHGVT